MMFCEPEEIKYLNQVTKLIHKDIPLIKNHPYHLDLNTKNNTQSTIPQSKGRFQHRARPSGETYSQSRSESKQNRKRKRA
jgi:hypothetical protein